MKFNAQINSVLNLENKDLLLNSVDLMINPLWFDFNLKL